MPTHNLRYIGRVEFSLLDYVNICLAGVLISLSIWSGSLLLGAVFGGFSALIVTVTLYGGRLMARIREY